MSARRLAVVAGSGMATLAGLVEAPTVTPFAAIPGVGACGVDGHAGEVLEGTVAGRACVLVMGRRHGYEGEFGAVARLMEHLAACGATDLVVTSAAGALATRLHPGDILVVHDLINRHSPRLAGRFPGARPDAALTATVERAALAAGVAVQRGTVVSCTGPAYETVAEVGALQAAAGDAATMSGAPELAAAAACGLRAAALAIITNPCTGIRSAAPSHAEVLRVGRDAAAGLARLIKQLVVEL